MSVTAFAIPSAEEVAEHVPAFERSTAIFLSGSLVAGFGHANSDVDVYVVLSTADELEEAAAGTRTTPVEGGGAVSGFYVGDVRWDTELVLAPEIEKLIGRIEDAEDVDQFPITAGEIDLVYRISVGAAIRGHELVDAWQQRLAASRFGDILVSRYLEDADGLVEDALGLLDVGDIHTAAYCTRLAYEIGTQAMLARSGRYCPGSKWRIAQLGREPAGSVTLEEYLDVVEMRDFTCDGPWIERVLARVRSFAFEV
jgi:hypothetical protein